MKDLEEAAREYENKELHIEDGQYTSTAIIEAFKAGVEFAQQWISVEDEMPQVGGEYLVKRNEVLEIEKWTLNKNNVGFWWDYLGITHWRPIELK